ncbi:M56 family metallopeptidase [Yinghuangia seranimata]|uniref:M56 family metallopeptidase n=1 Tax=Yinghuangia seranimata TaxID=408067 RepID=UPI00248BDE72|nr:M56 family metallopeptidase [Yinghuangia seranimata]MDI2126042.1 M56 family metallopeptidase [Yinghuangia seranimata]
MVHGFVLTLFAAAILATAPFVLDHAEASGFNPRLVQQGWRAAAAGALASLALAVPVFTPDLWTAPARAVGINPDIALVHVPLPAQLLVAGAVLTGLVAGWRRGGPVVRDYRRALRVQLDRLERTSPVLDDVERGHPRLVIVEDTQPRLVLLPSRPPRVEVTTRALDLLKPEELNAVLTHMAGHLRRRDALWMTASEAMAEAFPRLRFFARWADHSAALAEKGADADVEGPIARANLRRALAKLSGPGQANGPFCPCFAWPQQRQAELDQTTRQPRLPRPPVAVAGLRALTAAAVVVPTLVVVSPHFLYL